MIEWLGNILVDSTSGKRTSSVATNSKGKPLRTSRTKLTMLVPPMTGLKEASLMASRVLSKKNFSILAVASGDPASALMISSCSFAP